jgi:hypothetical protein
MTKPRTPLVEQRAAAMPLKPPCRVRVLPPPLGLRVGMDSICLVSVFREHSERV